MPKKVLVPMFIQEPAVALLAANNVEVIKSSMSTTAELIKDGKDVDAILAMTTPITEDVFSNLKNLKIIARYGVGFDNVDLAAATKHNVIVTNTPGANAVSVAETTLTLMLNLLNHVPTYDAALKTDNHELARTIKPGLELANKTVGLIGYGSISKRVEERLNAFGVRILISNRTKRDFKYGVQVQLPQLLKESDIVSIHVPDTPDTHHLIGETELAAMKKTAFIVNTARGGVIDEAALITALKAGVIAGAGLDVFETEPLPASSELRQLPNVVLTPHIGARTVEAGMRMAMMAVEEILRVFNGDKPTAQLN